MRHPIQGVRTGSPAARAGLRPGDALLAIAGEPVRDEIDYQYLSALRDPTIAFERDGVRRETIAHKGEHEPLGLSFDAPLQSTRMCANRCRFCFVDQLPTGVRDSLCVKDDDWRLSLMMGNYVTLTNVFDREMRRIVERRAAPLYISVHATDPDVRLYLCGHKPPDRLMDQLHALCDADLPFHAQIVLCPDINDGDVLERSLRDLWSLGACARSVALVPVGLTGHRAGLSPLKPYTAALARDVLAQAERWQQRALDARGTRWVFAADELYSLSGEPLPDIDAYEDFPQIENGVGLLAMLRDEIEAAEVGAWGAGYDANAVHAADAVDATDTAHAADAGAYQAPFRPASSARRVVIATGTSAAPYLRAWLGEKGLSATATVVAIENRFFGTSVTVAGLVTGSDIAAQLGRPTADEVLIPACMLRAGEDVFLDGMRVDELSARLGVPIRAIDVDGQALVDAIIGR